MKTLVDICADFIHENSLDISDLNVDCKYKIELIEQEVFCVYISKAYSWWNQEDNWELVAVFGDILEMLKFKKNYQTSYQVITKKRKVKLPRCQLHLLYENPCNFV